MTGIYNFIASLISRIDPTMYEKGSFSSVYFWRMISGWFEAFGQEIVSWFYWLCKWFLAFVDFLQYFVQKLIGLDYWLNSTSYSVSGAIDNDILFSFLFDETVQRVFRAMIAVFFVLLIIFTVVQIIRQEWQYITGEKFGDGKGNSKTLILRNSIKAIAIVIMFPIILVVSIISSNAILASLVKALNIDMSSTFGATLFQISSQNASKYQNYATKDSRLPTSDKVIFYTVKSKNNEDFDSTQFYTPLYLKISTGVGSSGYKITSAGFDYANDNDPIQEPVSFDVSFATYYNLVAQYENNPSSSVEKEVNIVIAGQPKPLIMRKNVVNSVFDYINPSSAKNFKGFCAGIKIDNTMQYYMVQNSGSTNESMYHYLHDVLKVPIMSSDRDLGNTVIHDDVKSKFTSIEGISCLISGLNIDSINSSGRSFGVDDACYNTWSYPSAYNVGREFINCESVIPVRDAEFLADIGLEGFSAVTAFINNEDYSQRFDGGQLGNVQLQTEYLVMAEVINFMQENDVGLYVMNANSSSIDWNYGDYAPESRWVSSKALDLQKDTGNTRAETFNCLPFVVSYDETAPEVGNVLYMSRYDTTNEIDGAKYIMCWKVAQNNKYVYVPVINGKTFTDPATNKAYRFSSDYYTSTYRGVVVAKGTFDKSVDGTDAWRGNPTYLKNSVKNVNENGTSAIIDTNSPYYFHALSTGGINSYASVSLYDGDTKPYSPTTYQIKNITTATSGTGGAQSQEIYTGSYKEAVGNFLRYELHDSGGNAVNFNNTTVQGLTITLAYATDPDRLTTATYANQMVESTQNDGGHWTYFLFKTNSGYYFRLAKCDIDGQNYLEFQGSEAGDEKQMVAAKFTYDITLTYEGIASSDGKKTLAGETKITGVTLDEFVHSSGDLYRLPGQSVEYKYSDDSGSESRYETVYVYLNTSNSEFVTMSGERQPSDGLGLSLKNAFSSSGSVRQYSTKVYSFYLYNFMTGLAQDDGAADSTSNIYEYSDGNVTHPDLPTEDGWTFTVKISTDDFRWPQSELSYNLYNGSTYVATLYKTNDQVINNIDDILHNTIRINYGGDIYYNIYTNNRFVDKDELKASYDGLLSDFIVGCYRDNISISFMRTDVNSFMNLIFLGRMRFYFQFGVPTMDREQLSLALSLQEGIKFDYFFSGTTVGLQDLYIVTSIQYWLIIVGSILIIKVLGKAIWGVIKRFYTITLYFLAMPASASLIPFGGDKFKTNIQTPLIQEILSTYGVILGINVFFILLMPVKSISNIFTQADIETSGSYFLKHMPFSSSTTARILNTYVYVLFVLVAFTMIDSLPTVISTMVGGNNVVTEGESVKKSVKATAQTVGKTWSGQGFVEGIKGVGHAVTQTIPGMSLITGGAGLVKAGVNKAREHFNKGAEGGDESGGSEQGTSEGGSDGSATSSRDEEGVDEEGGGAEGGAATAGGEEAGGGEATEVQNAGEVIASRTGMTEEDASSDKESERAAYFAAESMYGAPDDEGAMQQSFIQEAIASGGVSSDVLGADFDKDAAKANTFRANATSNAAVAGAASSMLNDNGFANASDEAKIDAIKSTMSASEQQQFDRDYNNASETEKAEMLDSYAFVASNNGKVSVGKKAADGTVDPSNMRVVSSDMSKNLIDDALKNTSDADIAQAIAKDKGVESAVNTSFANNIAVGVDFSAGAESGAASRILNMASTDRNLQNEALINAVVDNPSLVAKYGIASGENGADREKVAELINGNDRVREELMQRVGSKQYDESFRKVVADKVKSGEFKVSAWDLQKDADPEKLREFEARRKAQLDLISKHNVLENTSSTEKAAILTAIATNMQDTKVGDKLKEVLGRDAIGNLNADDVKKLDEAGLTELLARTATLDRSLTTLNGVETATRYEAASKSYTPKTAEELETEVQMSRELVAGDFEKGDEGKLLLAQTFANSNVEGKEDIASQAVRNALSANMNTAEQERLLNEARKSNNIQDLNAQGYSDEDIALAQKAAELLGGNMNDHLANLRDDPTKLFNSIMSSNDQALKLDLSGYVSENITHAQKGQLIDIAATSAFATMNESQQNEKLVELAKLDGSIMEQVGAGATDDQIKAFIEKNNELRESLIKKASEATYIAVQDPSKVNQKALQEAVLKNKQIDAILQSEGASISADDIKNSLDSADGKTQQAFIDTYIEKSGIISDDERLRIRVAAARDYLAKKNRVVNASMISDMDVAKALDEDAGAMDAAEAALKATIENRLSHGLGSKNALIADAVKNNKKLMNAAEKEFMAQYGTDFDNADTLTQEAFLAKYENKLDVDTIKAINTKYFTDTLKTKFQSNATTKAQQTQYNKWLSNLQGIITSQSTAEDVKNGKVSIDAIIEQQLSKGTAGRNNGLNISLAKTDILQRLVNDQDAYQSVYDSLAREQGQEGIDAINAAKRNHIKAFVDASTDPSHGDLETSLGFIKAGVEVDPTKLTGTDRRDYDYNKGILSKEVLQNGRNDLLENVFNNVNFLGKDKILAELSGGKSFEEILRTNEELKTKLLNLGAQDMKLTLTNRALSSKEADVVKNTTGLKNDLLAFIKAELAAATDKNVVAKKYGIDPSKISSLSSLDDITNLNAAIDARKQASSTFAKALSDGVTKDVSYSSHASEEDKQRFFDNEAAEEAAKARKDKYKYHNISEAYNGFVTTSIVGHAAQNVLFKLTKRLPKESSAYVNYNRQIDKQIKGIEESKTLSRADKDEMIRELQAKKVNTALPANFANMTAEEQQSYKRQQELNKRIAFKEGNFNWMKKGGLAIKATFGNIGIATSKTASRVGLAIGTKLSFLPFARTEGVKTRHKDDFNVIAANISRYKATEGQRTDDDFKDIPNGGIDKLSESYGLDAKRVKKLAEKLADRKDSNGKAVYSSIEEARKAAVEMLLNRDYRVASKKVARDEKQNKRSYFDGYGVGEENVRYKEANTKYLTVQSHIHTHLPVPFLNKAVNAAVTRSRMKNVQKVETAMENGTAGDLAWITRHRYDKIYGRKTEASGIKAQNNVVNAQNMIAELQKFNSTYKGDSKLYMENLFNNFKQKFGEETTRDILRKVKISADGKDFNLKRMTAAGDGLGGFTDLTKRSFSIQTREIERLLREQMQQQQRRALYSSAAIPASSDAATAFIGKTLTGAKTRVQVENDQRNAENLNKLLHQIEAQKGIVKLSADPNLINADVLRLLNSSALAEKFRRSNSYNELMRADSDAARYEAIENFVKRELNKANNRVLNNNYFRDQRSQLQKLNGVYVDRREISRGSAEARQAFRASQDPVYERIQREYHVMRNIVRNQEADQQRLLEQLREKDKRGQYMSAQTRREVKKLQAELNDLQKQLERNREKLRETRARFDAKLDSFAAQNNAQRSTSAQNYTISNNAPLDVKIKANLPQSERTRLEKEIRQAVLDRAKESLTAINNRARLTPEMESKIRSILGSYNFNDKLSKLPELMSKIQSELDSEISKLQNSNRREVRLRMEELRRKLRDSERAYKAKQKKLERQIKDLENSSKENVNKNK